ncbi:tRNA (adenosine(37)-N6)-threonylcarbamoyltransferase complex dimerization subunit type 1 TsaB [Defluviimonas sp. WL0050]|uniref:tRNA (Adenosine(37)-N6)-threonylcarbamoyltransferase complex dimerization subunit type 1 TsaB n=1 Tax=Albidovulum litorale TaxID=2984134 RepID=A0ABT2ZKU0_9RHOB|nr:tRNA (adenosine(37)-N6)-threonylcarbamoyltransferase complex dimerization subunit type 1 TsaB [Defluviimonas sp. WL0050]MCV2871749.1 tRNA (adenosine(37)-N6)-threonylcarbamoyltransferase complex dimerization subunit type 1 TsaB [Defluviimonas sp. WL0050]
MPPEPLILAFDTSAAHCAAALLSGESVLAARVEEMGRGQAERLMPMLEEMLGDEGRTWSDVSAIGVGTGPGNFTGIRISVAAARGLALSLSIPAVGVSGFEATAPDQTDPHWAVIPAPRGMVYAQRLGADTGQPELLPEADLTTLDAPILRLDTIPGDRHATHIARVAARRWRDTPVRPAPLYIRPADAAPPREAPPVILP